MPNNSFHAGRITLLRRGGRIARIGKRVVSYAPFIGVVIAATAGPALAAGECGTATPGATLICSGPSYPSSIAYSGVDGLTLQLDNPAMTVATPTANPAVQVSGAAGSTGAVTIDATRFSTINGTIINPMPAVLASSAGSGAVSVTMGSGAGSITSRAAGIRAESTGTGQASAVMTGGSIISQSDYAVYANVNNANSTAASSVRMDGGTINNTGSAGGIKARNGGRGQASAVMTSGTITTTQGIGVHAEIANNPNNTSTASAQLDGGRISTGATTIGHGLYALNSALGAAQVTINNGSIETNALNSRGAIATINNASNTANAETNMRNGSIITHGQTGIGLQAFTSGLGQAIATMTGGTIATSGTTAYGIWSATVRATNTSTASVDLDGGSVSTTGSGSFGLYATTNGLGDARVTVASGSVLTTAAQTHAALSEIASAANTGTARVTMTGGSVGTGGLGAKGLYATTNGLGQARTIMTAGTVATAGDGGHGLMSTVTNTGNTSMALAQMGGGIVDTTGAGATGLYTANSGLGTAYALLSRGTVQTVGGDSHAVYAEVSNATSTAAAVAQMDEGTILTTGENSTGLFAISVGLGDVSALMATGNTGAGTLTTSGLSAYGLSATISNTASTATALASMTAGSLETLGVQAMGLYATTNGSGTARAVVSGGTIHTNNSNSTGVYAEATSTAAASAEIRGGSVVTSGDDSAGLYAISGGDGASSVSMTAGTVVTSGNGSHGLAASINNVGGTGAVSAHADGGSIHVYGDNSSGLYALTYGLGQASALMTDGAVTTEGIFSTGISSRIDNTANTSTISARIEGGSITTTGARHSAGVQAMTSGLGEAIASMAGGTVTTAGSNSDGLIAEITNAASTATARVVMDGGSVATSGAGASGLRAGTLGSGAYGVSLNGGTVTTKGGDAYGIHTIGSGTGTIHIGASAVLSSAGGVAIRDGDAGVDTRGGNVTVSSAGTVTGGAQLGLGNDTFQLTAGALTGDIYGDDVVAQALDGNDSFRWTGGAFTGSFFGGGGTDTATITASGYTSTQGLHGGGGAGTDTLTFDGVRSAALNDRVTGWEQITITNGSVIGLRGTDANDLGSMNIAAGSALVAYDGLVLNGNLNAAGIIDLSGAQALAAVMAGSGSGKAGTELVAGGNFTGGGAVILDVNFAEAQTLSADRLMIGGDVTGHTTLTINNITPGRGVATKGDGILLVDVGGTAAADAFTLANGPITSGAFVYDLDYGGQADTNNNFYLVANLTPDAATYQAMPYVIANTFADLPGLVKRRAGRVPMGQPTGTVANGPLESLTGGWAQIEGGRNKAEASSGNRFSTDHWSLKAGYDADAGIPLPGKLIAGGYVTYAGAEDTVDSKYGSGSMSSHAIGAGVTATYYGEDGSYADLQGRVMGVRSDLDQVSGLLSTAAAGSAELGHVFALGSALSLVPSAQLQYGSASTSDFVDDLGNDVSGLNYDGLTSRLGMALQAAPGANPEAGPLLTASLDWIHDFSPEVGIIVEDNTVTTDLPENWLEAGLGVDWRIGQASLFEIQANYAFAPGQSLNNTSSLAASASFRLGL